MIQEYCKEMGISFFNAENAISMDEVVNLMKSLTVKCVNLVQEKKKLKEDYDQASSEVTKFRKQNRKLRDGQKLMKEKKADLECVKQYMGEYKV